MTEPLTRIGAPPQPPNRRRRVSWVVWAPPIVIFIGLLALAGGAYWAGRTPASVDDQPKMETFSVSGYVTLGLGKFVWDANPDVCTGMGAWKDLSIETPVVIADQNGTTIATGTLGVGEPVRNPTDSTRASACKMPIYVNSVPPDRPFYRVAIGDRKTVEYNRFDIKQPLDITID